jgi:Lrp/AsnC family leucine-responsive transcriptional regulator
VATDIADYEHLLRDKLTTLPDVQRLETTMVLRAIKEGGYIPTS